MPTIYEIHLGIYYPGELPSTIAEIDNDWENTLKGKRSKIITNLQRRVPDTDTYKEVIVERSNLGYTDFIGSDHPRHDEIMLKRQIKMEASASDYIANRDAAFEEGGDFEVGVSRGKSKFSRGKEIILQVVGDKDKFIGAVPKLQLCLLGKKSVLEATIESGTVDNLITSDDLKPFFKADRYVASVVATVNKYLTQVAYALRAGWSDSDIENKIATKANNELSGYVNDKMLNPDLDPSACVIEIKKDVTTGRWGVRVVEATPTS